MTTSLAVLAADITPDSAAAVGNTAWLLAAFALVALMVPGLALFYGGMVQSKSVLNVIMMVFGGFAVIAVLWTIVGSSMVLGNSLGGAGILGDPMEFFGMKGMLAAGPDDAIPGIAVSAFQLLFAGITVALVCGAVADRMKFSAWLWFAGLWGVLVYFPVAHWVFAFDSADGSVVGGWIANKLQAIDFAGGTAVHMNAGIAGLAVILVLGKRLGFPRQPRPHNLPTTVLGAGILFFGWFGFNGGSALGANLAASVAIYNTCVAACSGALAWIAVEKLREKHATTLGAMSGLITGLVAITPAAGAVSPLGAIAIGAVPGVVCFFAISWKYRLGYDDALDVVGIHLVGGLLGTLLIGLIADPDAPNGVAGLFYGGGFGLLGRQATAAGAVLIYSFVVAFIIAKVLDKVMGIRVERDVEVEGLDVQIHGETAYVTEQSMGAVSHPIAGSSPLADAHSAHERIAALAARRDLEQAEPAASATDEPEPGAQAPDSDLAVPR